MGTRVGRPWLRNLLGDEEILATVEPVSDPSTVAAARAALGDGATGWAVLTAFHATQGIVDEPWRLSGPSLLSPVRRACEGWLLHLLRALLLDLPLDQFGTPPELLDATREAVRSGVALERLMRTMWHAQTAVTDALLFDMRTRVGTDWEDDARSLGQTTMAYLEMFIDWLVREYHVEHDAWVGSVAAARRQLVTAVIAGTTVDLDEAAHTLGIRLQDHQVAAILWSVGDELVPDRVLLNLANALGHAASTSTLLTIQGEPSELWIWLGMDREPERDTFITRLRSAIPTGSLRAAVGPAAAGLSGLRASHLAAREAHRLAALEPEPLVDYRSIAMLALLTHDAEKAEAFAYEVLGGLYGEDERRLRLQDTLRAYLSSGRSRTAAAALLHIAPSTVSYRVGLAEQLLGKPVNGVDQDVVAALEVARAQRAVRVQARKGLARPRSSQP